MVAQVESLQLEQLYLKSKSLSLQFAHFWLRKLKHLISRPLITRGKPRAGGGVGRRLQWSLPKTHTHTHPSPGS